MQVYELPSLATILILSAEFHGGTRLGSVYVNEYLYGVLVGILWGLPDYEVKILVDSI